MWPGQTSTAHVVFDGLVDANPDVSHSLRDAELHVLDQHGRVIGSYGIGSVRVVRPPAPASSEGPAQCTLDFRGYSLPFPYADAVWRQWAGERPRRRGEWLGYPVEAHSSWLHVVQSAWAEEEDPRAAQDEPVGGVLDGRRVVGEDSFFCEIGEAVNGPGGYFGSNLDALEDCLVAPAGGSTPRSLLWEHSDASRDHLSADFVATVAEILRDRRVPFIMA
ncbi:barstar family protein [Luteimicrobium subarcticum]|uniref:RNAse (Barnase) inhibitor barstar n=1 Tax=Luteimicrobium subarcticum TaxID=620910 RepID=A0A2M8W1X6_9MICO|nr:barstar family protein [Luteimicrobium subarcticum]PJI84908.1 RNAse (barnase) inhibitor barstar [Luteimicrobium subarcticum]